MYVAANILRTVLLHYICVIFWYCGVFFACFQAKNTLRLFNEYLEVLLLMLNVFA